ncbi:MAG TPA: EI24 domain-containing protein, partial [Gammaproteobacteria bacterium]|nr:EI24 domain-containing protein [Gammaproteobacteria bacterium]
LIGPLWFLFSAWTFAVMMSDFPLGARNLNWPRQRELIRGQRGRMFGFGIGAACMAMVPILNLFLLPATTAGITQLWVEILEPEAVAANSRGN